MPGGSVAVHSPLIGGFNLYNIMAAVGAGVAMDIPLEVLKEGVESLHGVSGRLERVENGKGLHVFVDYAHTPDALERALSALASVLEEKGRFRSEAGEMIITVFGCGGDRDRTKRPLIGASQARSKIKARIGVVCDPPIE